MNLPFAGHRLLLSVAFLLVCCSFLSGQDSLAKKKRTPDHFSIALTNNHTAYPFASFSKLATGIWHPGVEFGTGLNWSVKPKHDWYQEFRAAYFYHQFIQHGVPLYTNFGYQYKFSAHWRARAGLGLGALLSFPDHKRYELNDNGHYDEINGIRLQGMFTFNLGAGYRFGLNGQHPLELFINYQQRLQTPYVPNYVPLLPYNSSMVGIRWYR